jgi:nucleoside-triphosphatase THEP1
MTSFYESGKKHLLITGHRKSGKTTVLKEILKDLVPEDITERESVLGGIITYAVRDEAPMPKYVILHDINYPDIKGLIARRDTETEAFIPSPETFENLGVNILKKYNNSEVELVVIDEIGYLEINCLQYQKEIIKSFDKTVIAVIRKELNQFTEILVEREDVFLIDIDTKKL